MAKHYVTVTIEGHTLDQVEEALVEVVGPSMDLWSKTHFLGIHIDVSDVSDAVEYGAKFESKGDDSLDQVKTETIEVDVYARSELSLRSLQLAIAETIASQLSSALGGPTKIRESD